MNWYPETYDKRKIKQRKKYIRNIIFENLIHIIFRYFVLVIRKVV